MEPDDDPFAAAVAAAEQAAASSEPPVRELRGVGRGNGAVYARAAVLEEGAGGRPTLSGDLLSLAFQRMKRGDGELDLILVAPEPQAALLLRLPPGLVLAGVVAEGALVPSPEAPVVPVVCEVADARALIPEGALLIVDAARGRVLVEPPAEEFALLQAERVRPRVRLGPSHLPASTMMGRVVPVWASVRTQVDLEAALEAGADGILLESGSDVLPKNDAEDPGDDDADSVGEARRFAPLLEAVASGDLALCVSVEEIDLADVAFLAANTRLVWALTPSDLPIPLPELRAELTAIAADLSEEGKPAAVPKLALLLDSLDGYATGNVAPDELYLPGDALAQITLADTFSLPPIRAIVTDSDQIDAAIDTAASLIVPPSLVADAKELVRAREY